MDNFNNDELSVYETEEIVTPEVTDENGGAEEAEESIEEIKERLMKAEELANNYKIRAEKAEKSEKIEKSEKVRAKESINSDSISPRDLLALAKSNIHEDDIAEVQEYARFKKLSIADALNSPVIKSLLNENQENRRVAEATNVGPSRRSPAKVSDDVLMSKASKGELPDNDDDLARLVRARREVR